MQTNGPNLQALIAGDCIGDDKVMNLSPQQLDAIENLTQAQIEVLIQVRQAVGPVYVAKMI
jgi:hypothetical protein